MLRHLITILSGFQFGYNTAVISGAILFLTGYFGWSVAEEGVAVSALLVGALIGACFAGALADNFGRKKTLHLMALIFLLSALTAATAEVATIFLLGRLFQGLAVGIVSMTAPLYLAEVSPPEKRGFVVSANQLAITVGILASYGCNYLLAQSGNWQMMIGIGAIPAFIQLIGFFFLPESPVQKNYHSAPWKTVFNPIYRKPLVLGLLLSIFQQITGINAVIYFAPRIFQDAGFSSASTAIFATFGLGIVNTLATMVALWLIDRQGRRPLLLIGTIGMTLSLALISVAFYTQLQMIDTIAVVTLMAYIAMFAIGLGPVPWLVLAEIYPTPIRGHAMTLATFANWFFNTLVAFTFLDLVKAITPAGAFSLFALLGAIAFLYFFKNLPETKSVSLN